MKRMIYTPVVLLCYFISFRGANRGEHRIQ